MSWKLALNAVLDVARPLFERDEPVCAILGSVATALQGCRTSPRDIDLLAIEPEYVSRFAQLMSSYTPKQCEHPVGHDQWLSSEGLPVSAGPDDYGFFWQFGRWKVLGMKVEIAHITAPEGFPTSAEGAGIWEAGPEIWHYLRYVPLADLPVPVVPLEGQLETNLQRGLEDRAAEIVTVLRDSGYDPVLIRRALTAEHRQVFETSMGPGSS